MNRVSCTNVERKPGRAHGGTGYEEERTQTMSSTMMLLATTAHALQTDVPADTRIGHIHLRVADLGLATQFYRDVLGFKVTFYGPSIGLPAVFLAAADYHHHLALNTFQGAGMTPPPVGHTGLHHFAILYPDELSLATAVARVLNCRHPLDDSRDHGGTLSVYLRDLDDNGIELYYDRPREEWFDSEGRPIIKSEPFDPEKWLDGIWSEGTGVRANQGELGSGQVPRCEED
jgi:catechol 2,3-dioxygenase